MTGLVVVSHSRALADAAVALAQEMLTGPQAAIEVAAGLDEDTFGTDATAIAQALEAAADDDGAVVLMDLGSAVLSAEMALELVDPQLRDRVVLSPAPLVEGLVLAAVSAAGGASPERVSREASGGLQAKREHLGVAEDGQDENGQAEDGATEEASDADAREDEESGRFELTTAHGLHARPASKFVALAQELLEGSVDSLTARNLTTGAGPVQADSMLEVLSLGAEHGHEVEVVATGEGAAEAVRRLLALAESRFGEDE